MTAAHSFSFLRLSVHILRGQTVYSDSSEIIAYGLHTGIFTYSFSTKAREATRSYDNTDY